MCIRDRFKTVGAEKINSALLAKMNILYNESSLDLSYTLLTLLCRSSDHLSSCPSVHCHGKISGGVYQLLFVAVQCILNVWLWGEELLSDICQKWAYE